MKNLYEETRSIMKKYKITAAKSLGQNFLIDEEVVNKIVESAGITKEDMVIEIGPGLGTLTLPLLEKAKKVICIELDSKMIQILNDRFSMYDNIEIINEDVLKINLKKLILENKQINNIKNVKIVANLPYYITTPIVMKLLEEELDLESITIMIQKEVAKRLSSVPGDKETGAITYSVYYYSKPEEIMVVPNNSFIPEPEVESEVIKLNIRSKKQVNPNNKELFFKIIKVAFMQRRKTLLNSLVNGGIIQDKQTAKDILQELNLDENIRAEKLTIEDFEKISNVINKM